MKKYPVKIIFMTYAMLLLSLSVGWYSEEGDCDIGAMAARVRDLTKNLCLMEENRVLFRQDVRETGVEERKAYEQTDEDCRRTSYIVQKGTEDKKQTEFDMGVGVDKGARAVLERIVEAEAGDQDMKGRMLVANVVVNRVKSEEFPDTVEGVVFAHRQFSPVSNGSYYRVEVSDLTREAVRRVLKGEDYSKGALYFMDRAGATASNAAWFDRDLTRLFRHGCHEFFR